MGCLINYEVTDLNILYFYNFPYQSPGLSTLENLLFPLSSAIHLSSIQSLGALHPKKIKKYKGVTLAKYFEIFF